MTVYFKKIYPDSVLPTWGHDDPTNAGVDLYSHDTKTISPHSFMRISTGVSWYINPNISDTTKEKWVLIVQSRSGLAFNADVEASNAGVIDQGYTGEIYVKLINNSDIPFSISKGERIAQGLIYRLPIVKIAELTPEIEVTESKRGSKGFGSSGVK